MYNFEASPERLIIGALLGFAILLFLIIKFKSGEIKVKYLNNIK